jgi:hypothetical protein
MNHKEKLVAMRNIGVVAFWLGVAMLATYFWGLIGLGVTLIVFGVFHMIPSK